MVLPTVLLESATARLAGGETSASAVHLARTDALVLALAVATVPANVLRIGLDSIAVALPLSVLASMEMELSTAPPEGATVCLAGGEISVSAVLPARTAALVLVLAAATVPANALRRGLDLTAVVLLLLVPASMEMVPTTALPESATVCLAGKVISVSAVLRARMAALVVELATAMVLARALLAGADLLTVLV